MSKLRVGVIFGGKSAEHEVSLQSAKNIVDAIDKEKYNITLIGIDKEGKWHINEPSNYLLHAENPKLIQLNQSNQHVAFVPGEEQNKLLSVSKQQVLPLLDAVFPIVHGTLGEDGCLQGLLRVANIPFVGSGVLGSALCMDKDIAKKLFCEAGLKVAKGLTFHSYEQSNISFQEVKAKLGLPMFIKPANQGSSVGVSKVKNEEAFYEAMTHAFLYDHKILIEEAIKGREIECSVLGNEKPIASVPGEILPQREFYSYDAKYIDENGALLNIPAAINEEQIQEVQQLSIKAFKALQCEGLARVDFFLTEDQQFYINEINTLPGFTKISMYPKLWEASGIKYPQLINQLIELALQRAERDKRLKSTAFDI
jgi:D-alanine-D-alanine ligase